MSIASSNPAVWRYQNATSPPASAPTTSPSPIQFSGKIRLFHYSKESNLRETDPNCYGTGWAGKEKERRDSYPEGWVSRTYYGTKDYERESGLGQHKYYTDVDEEKLYDIDADPLHLWSEAKEECKQKGLLPLSPAVITFYEKQISQLPNVIGYLAKKCNVAAIFKKLPVTPVTRETTPDPLPETAKRTENVHSRPCIMDRTA